MVKTYWRLLCFVLVILAAHVPVPAGSGDCVRGDGNPKTVLRDLAGYSGVEIRGAFQVEISGGRSHRFQLSGESNLLDHVTSVVHGDVLTVGTDRPICATQPLILEIDLPVLGRLVSDGSNRLHVQAIDSETFNLELRGSSRLTLAGRSREAELLVSGAGTVSGRGFQVGSTHIVVDGTGNVEISVTEALRADIIGIGNVYYYGNPSIVTPRINGIGRVERRE